MLGRNQEAADFFESATKKRTASDSILFKELKPNLIDISILTKMILKNLFTFCLITLVESCQNI